MYKNLQVTLALLLVVGLPLHLKATAQAPSGEVLSKKALHELERSATTASDHERLAAYYQSQAQKAQQNLADAEELEKKWGPMESASKVPDPYPHARRLVLEYTAEVQKYSRLAADHQWIADKYGIAARALKAGGSASESSTNESGATANRSSARNGFTLGPKK